MPIYLFERRDGTVVEHFLPVTEAPEIGEHVVIEHETVRRVVSPMQLMKPKEYQHVGRSAPVHHPAAPRVDEFGSPVFHTKKEVREFEAASGVKWD